MAMSFTIAIVGRPNVGKSTLFNRLVGRRLALVDDLPGVTRDRREGQARLGDLDFTIIDTAGLEEAGRREPRRPDAGADQVGDRAGRRGVLHARCEDRTGAGRPRLCRPGAALRQAGDRRRQQGRGQGQRRPGAGGLRAWSRRSGRHLGRARRGAGRSVRGAARSLAGRHRKTGGRRSEGCRATRCARSVSPWSGGRTPASRRW